MNNVHSCYIKLKDYHLISVTVIVNMYILLLRILSVQQQKKDVFSLRFMLHF